MKLVKPNLSEILYVCRNIRDADREELAATAWGEDLDELAVRVHQHWGKFVWVAGDERPIAVIGATPLWPGVWAAFMFATDEIRQAGQFLTRAAKKVMINAVVETDCHRIEARSMAGHGDAHRWLRALGFREESVLKKYGRDQQDFIVFTYDPSERANVRRRG